MNSHCFKLYRSYSISFDLWKFWQNFLGLNPKEPAISKFRKRKRIFFFVVFTYSIFRAREIRNPATMARKCTKKRDTPAKFCFANINLLFIAVLVAVAVDVA